MAFVKSAWRILVGIKDGLVLLFLLLFFGLLYMALSFSPTPPTRASSGALVLDLDGTIVEQPEAVSAFDALSAGEPRQKQYRLRDIVTALDAAKSDSNVKAVVLNLDSFMGGGQVALDRVGKALDGVRAAKKPVLAFATAYVDDGYQLASHASEIWVNPIGGVTVTGPGGSRLYYKGLIDRLGVTAHVYRVGTYKSFVEPYIRKDQSPEAKAADRALAGALWANWREGVKQARPGARIDAYTADIAAAARATGGDLARAAMNARLVDRIGDEQAFGAHVAQIAGTSGDKRPGGFARIELSRYARANRPSNDGPVGVLTIAGEIVDGEGGPGKAAGDTLSDLLYDALATGKLKALVVRVDSPGGSVLASEKIRGAILAAKKQRLPVIVSMGNVAASGGYWVSTPADRIFAEPSTITGSIGVFGIVPSFEGTLARIGVTTDGVKTTPLSGEPNVAGGLSPQFDTIAQLGVEDVYRRFVGLVAQSRRKSPAQVDTIAQGRVWDGGTARRIGLVDRFGGVEDAIAEAARLAKLDPAMAKPTYIEKQPGMIAALIQDYMDSRGQDDAAGGGDDGALPRDLLSREAWMQRQWALQAVSDAKALVGGGSIRAACLECRGYAPPATADRAAERSFMALLAGALW